AREARMARAAGACVVLDGGELRLCLESAGRSRLTEGRVEVGHLQALALAAARSERLEIQSIDGQPVRGSALEPLLREAGFSTTPRGLVLWPEREPAGRH